MREVMSEFQDAVMEWMMECFGAEISDDRRERSHRFIEEAIELVQATGITREEVLMLVDYVYGRPPGEVMQEVGGVTVTLAALCGAHKISMQNCAVAEVARVWTKIDVIRAKQATKPRGSPLPMRPDDEMIPALVRRMDER